MLNEPTQRIYDELPPKTWKVTGWLPDGNWKTVRIDDADVHALINLILNVHNKLRDQETAARVLPSIPNTSGFTLVKDPNVTIINGPNVIRRSCSCGDDCNPGHCINVPC